METGINSFHAALPFPAGYLKSRYSKDLEKSGRHDLNVRLPAPKAHSEPNEFGRNLSFSISIVPADAPLVKYQPASSHL